MIAREAMASGSAHHAARRGLAAALNAVAPRVLRPARCRCAAGPAAVAAASAATSSAASAHSATLARPPAALLGSRAAPRPRPPAQQRQPRRRVACASTPSPRGVAWLDTVRFGEHFGAPGNGAGAGNGAAARAGGAAASAVAALAASGPPLDAVVMLAGGLHPDGGLPDWVSRRLDTSFDIHLTQQRRCPILMLGGGTPHKPPVLAPSGHVVHESTSCADYLISKGADAGALLKEVSSYDTVGNAYFALTIHAIPAGWRRVAVVTSEFHMPRAVALFETIWGLAGRSVYGDESRFELMYVSSSDEGVFDDYVYQARVEKEAQAVANWKATAAKFTSLADFHQWFYSDHLCYAVPKQHLFGVRTIKDERLLASY
ncbi:hypothetical protein Rsub_06214 [Raphidocelis subcapitata]|uniref:DUF218 domain-containing protein n=1 Tax=Raphidocelis subcapitata TaxID=307507 RepID=A0A2V0PA38_9CHLO|nr:hypothetical protein Rsub_06214 [Raphidocelis subcapitata]|eukprot:GBF93965.1 hypothetical protein Rsub_06214 [Raphidocelis subcapitata]